MKTSTKDSKILSLLGLTLISSSGCVDTVKDDSNLQLYLTKDPESRCVSEKLCALSFGEAGCNDSLASAFPVFASKDACEGAFALTSYRVKCISEEFKSYAEHECTESEEQVIVDWGEETEQDKIKTVSCNYNQKKEVTLETLWVPQKQGFFSNSFFIGSDALNLWFGGEGNQRFMPSNESEASSYKNSPLVTGYMAPGLLKPASSKEELERVKKEISSCGEGSSMASQLAETIGQSLDRPYDNNEIMRSSQSNVSTGNMFMWWWLASSMNRNNGYFNSPYYARGSGMGFTSANSPVARWGNRGAATPSPFYSSANGIPRPLTSATVNQGLSNASHLRANSTTVNGRTVVRGSSFRSGGFGSTGSSRSSYSG